MRFLVSCLAAAVTLLAAVSVNAQQSTPATAALVIDLNSGTVLLEKDADRPLPPASMSKLMTLNMVFEALQAGRLAMTDQFRTTAKASNMGGSKMFLREGELVSIEDLLHGVIIQSGNDAAVALGEALMGTEEAFAAQMNQRAEALGLTNSSFANATGWPDPDQRMSVRDIATLSTHIITQFPEYYPMFAETEFTWDGITQSNRNPLLSLGIGADGLKTGHTEEAGYGLAASAKRGDRRVVVVVTGLESSAQRRQEAERLINWAFRAFESTTAFKAGEPLATADVWIGSSSTVPLVPERDVILLYPAGTIDQTTMKVRYDGPITAPFDAGDRLGVVEIQSADMPPVTVPLVASHAVAEGGFLSRLEAAANLLINRVLSGEG
ncbi:D-alanyl-D-alanine carboxypeptidase [Rhodobacteraceae bacterium NNCM2]|nr:D-alanyl-D-alanine carboxypeptidase [Coraliihabitans acroporae]